MVLKAESDHTFLIEGCESAIVGLSRRQHGPPVVVYDYFKLLTIYQGQGMTAEEAEAWVDGNVVGAWLGPGTPAVMFRADADEVQHILNECEHPHTTALPSPVKPERMN